MIMQRVDEADLHLGLDVAESHEDIEQLIAWAKNGIANFCIQVDDRNYAVLVDAAEVLRSTANRQRYWRFIYSECMKNAR